MTLFSIVGHRFVSFGEKKQNNNLTVDQNYSYIFRHGRTLRFMQDFNLNMFIKTYLTGKNC